MLRAGESDLKCLPLADKKAACCSAAKTIEDRELVETEACVVTSGSEGVSGDGQNARGVSIDPALFPPHGANPHYMDHLVAIAEVRDVEACEDVYAGNGTKLIAKGTRVDARMRDRLLEHKLNKPLEDCVTVSDAVSSDDLRRAAEALLDRHSMLSELCSQPRPVTIAGLTSLHLSPAMQSLLT